MLWFGEAALNPTHSTGIETRPRKTYRTFTWNMWRINREMANQGLRSHLLFSWRYLTEQDHIKNTWNKGARSIIAEAMLHFDHPNPKFLDKEIVNLFWETISVKVFAKQISYSTWPTTISHRNHKDPGHPKEFPFVNLWVGIFRWLNFQACLAIHRNHLPAFPLKLIQQNDFQSWKLLFHGFVFFPEPQFLGTCRFPAQLRTDCL